MTRNTNSETSGAVSAERISRASSHVRPHLVGHVHTTYAPSRVPGDHDLFICGNDAAAKREVAARLSEWFGWKPGNIIDLGDITNSRGTEMFLALWVRLWGVVGNPHFNIHVVRGK